MPIHVRSGHAYGRPPTRNPLEESVSPGPGATASQEGQTTWTQGDHRQDHSGRAEHGFEIRRQHHCRCDGALMPDSSRTSCTIARVPTMSRTRWCGARNLSSGWMSASHDRAWAAPVSPDHVVQSRTTGQRGNRSASGTGRLLRTALTRRQAALRFQT